MKNTNLNSIANFESQLLNALMTIFTFWSNFCLHENFRHGIKVLCGRKKPHPKRTNSIRTKLVMINRSKRK
jgi:hypothetical protein